MGLDMGNVCSPAGRPFRDGIFTQVGNPRVTKLIGSRCVYCGCLSFPNRLTCARCRADSAGLVEVELGPGGHLYTFAHVLQAPKPFRPPYVIGYVDLDEGVRVFTQFEVADAAELQLGMRVEACVGRLYTDDEGIDVLTYKFRPAVAEGATNA